GSKNRSATDRLAICIAHVSGFRRRQFLGLLRWPPSIRGVAQAVRNNSAPPKWSKLWTDAPKPGDRIGAYTPEQFEQMNQEFTAAVERAFRSGGESFLAASRTYDVRRPVLE